MKRKMIFVLFLLLGLVVLASCKEEKTLNPTLDCEDLIVKVGDSVNINPVTNINKPEFQYSFNDNYSFVKIDGNIITASEAGEALLTISVKGYDIKKEIKIMCALEGIVIVGPDTVEKNETAELSIIYVGIDEDDVSWSTNNHDIARCSKGVITGIELGEFTVTAKCGDYNYKKVMKVVTPLLKDFTVEEGKEEILIEAGETYEVKIDPVPALATLSVTVSSEDSNLKCVENTISSDVIGESEIIVKSESIDLSKKIKVKVVKSEAPVFEKQSDYEEEIIVNFGSALSAAKGLKVIDNIEGDITDRVTCDNMDKLQSFGKHEITLVATDRAGNKTEFKRTVNVAWGYKTKFIGHQGCYYAVPNTEEAFRYAASVMHYQALECDIRSTKDGVLVICHDAEFAGATISQTNYADLAKLTKTSSQFGCPQTYYGAKQYTGHICSFDTYLDICKEYNVSPVIELKGAYGMDSGNTSELPTLMNILREKGIYDNAIILTSMGPCITFLRNRGETIKCQYLVNGASKDSVLNFCIENHCDVSVNVTYGESISDEYIKKYHDAGCEISTWTFTSYCDYPEVQKWIDKGVDYVTCDWHYIDKDELELK